MPVASEVQSRSPLLSYEKAAERVGPEFDARQVKWWVTRGWLTPVRIGQRTFVRQDDLDRFLDDAEGAAPGNRKRAAS